MLGRLGMTVEERLEDFEFLGDSVCGHPRRFHIGSSLGLPRPKYDHVHLEKAIKEIVKQRNPLGHANTIFRQPNEDMCRT